jgi:uncharacterized protein (TIGR01244 family)
MADIRRLTEGFAAAPQIAPGDCAAIAAAGFVHIVNNRPDSEVPASHAGAAIAAAARAAGLGYTAIPVDHSGFSRPQLDALAAVLEAAPGPVIGYCRSGTRSALLWALTQAARGGDPDSIAAAAARGGYDVGPVRPLMARLAGG